MCEAKHILYSCGCKKTKIRLCLPAVNKNRRRPAPCPVEKQTKFELVPQAMCANCQDTGLKKPKLSTGVGGEKPKQPKSEKSLVAKSSQAVVGDDHTGDIEEKYFEGDDLIALGSGRTFTMSKEDQGRTTSNVTEAGFGTKDIKDTKENQKEFFIGDDLIAFE